MHRAAALGLTLASAATLVACAAPDGAAGPLDLEQAADHGLILAAEAVAQGSARPHSTGAGVASPAGSCTEAGELWLDLTPSEEHPAVVEVQALLPEALPFEGTLTVSWTESDGREVAFSRALTATEDAWLGTLWGLPPDTEVSVDASWARPDRPGERWCLAAPELVRTGTPEASDFPAHAVHHRTTDPERQAELDALRFLAVAGSGQGARAFMLDTRGRLLWHQSLDRSDLVKGVALHPDGEQLFVMGVNQTVGERGSLLALSPAGGRVEHCVDHPLHHAMSFDAQGRLLALGWEAEELHGETVVTDTLVRFDLEAGTSEVLWRTWDSLDRPSAETLAGMSGAGIYGDAEAIAYGYANGLGVDVASGTAAIALGGTPAGLVRVDLDGEQPPAFLRNRAPASEGLPGAELLPEDLLVRKAHHAWADDTGRVLIYNRRDASTGTTIDALRWTPAEDGQAEALEIEQSIALLDAEGLPDFNSHLGTAWPVDLDFTGSGALMAGYHPFADHALTVHTAPFDPEREGLEAEELLHVGLAEGQSLTLVGGFMEAWSLERLHAPR